MLFRSRTAINKEVAPCNWSQRGTCSPGAGVRGLGRGLGCMVTIDTRQEREKLLFYPLTDIKQGCMGALQSIRLHPEAEYRLELSHCGSARPQKLSDVRMGPKPVFQRGINARLPACTRGFEGGHHVWRQADCRGLLGRCFLRPARLDTHHLEQVSWQHLVCGLETAQICCHQLADFTVRINQRCAFFHALLPMGCWPCES